MPVHGDNISMDAGTAEHPSSSFFSRSAASAENRSHGSDIESVASGSEESIFSYLLYNYTIFSIFSDIFLLPLGRTFLSFSFSGFLWSVAVKSVGSYTPKCALNNA